MEQCKPVKVTMVSNIMTGAPNFLPLVKIFLKNTSKGMEISPSNSENMDWTEQSEVQVHGSL